MSLLKSHPEVPRPSSSALSVADATISRTPGAWLAQRRQTTSRCEGAWLRSLYARLGCRTKHTVKLTRRTDPRASSRMPTKGVSAKRRRAADKQTLRRYAQVSKKHKRC